jgi:KaiC/GvpD/RAD55 family RecA-like ATPase
MKIIELTDNEISERKESKRKKRHGVWFKDLGNPKPLPYLVKGVVGEKSNVLIYGPSGAGKTFVTLDLIARVAAGLSWCGHRVKKGLCVYIAAEAGDSILPRFAAWRDRHLHESPDGDVFLFLQVKGFNLLNDDEVDDLMQTLLELAEEAGLPLKLVAIDTLSRSIPGGDENTAKDMTRVVMVADRIRDELHAATVIVHHTGKDAAKGARGHSALFAAADSVLYVSDGVITVEKCRDGQSGESIGFTLEKVGQGIDEDGDELSTRVMVPTGATCNTSRVKSLTATGKVALQSLREAIRGKGEMRGESSSMPGMVLSVRLDEWSERFTLRYGSDLDGKGRSGDATRKAFKRGKESLLGAGLITISDPFVWLVHAEHEGAENED